MRLFLAICFFLLFSLPVHAQFFPSQSPSSTITPTSEVTVTPFLTPTISTPTPVISPGKMPLCSEIKINDRALGFSIPSFSDLLTFVIRLFFTIAGLAALMMLLLGAFAWVTSGGDKGNVEKAQAKIQAAVVGVIMIVVVLAIMWTIENVIFSRKVCIGLSCPVTIPSLIKGDPNTPNRPTNCIDATATPTIPPSPTNSIAPSDPSSSPIPTESSSSYNSTDRSTNPQVLSPTNTAIENPPQFLPSTGGK